MSVGANSDAGQGSRTARPLRTQPVRLPDDCAAVGAGAVEDYLVVGILIGALAVSCLVLFVLALIRFDIARDVVAGVIPSNYLDRFSRAAHNRLILIMRTGAAVGLVATAALARFHLRFTGKLRNARSEAAMALQAASRHLAEVFCGSMYGKAAIAIALCSTLLRALYLFQPVMNDEAYTMYYYASRPVVVPLLYYTANNHPLNTILMHFSTALLGHAEWAVRLPAFFAGILIVPALYLAVRMRSSAESGIIAAALAGVSIPLIEYSANGRGYSMGTLMLILMIVLSARDDKIAKVGCSFTAALAIFSVPTMVYGVAAVFVWLLVVERRSPRQVVAVGAMAAGATLALYAPAAFYSGISAIVANRWSKPLAFGEWRSTLMSDCLPSLIAWKYWTAALPAPFAGLTLGAAALGAVWRRSLFGVALGTAIVTLAVQRVSPPTRTWLFLVPLMLWSAADATVALIRRTWVFRASPYLGCAMAIWLGALPFVWRWRPSAQTSGDTFRFPNARAAAQFIQNGHPAGVRIACCAPWDNTVKFYLQQMGAPESDKPKELLLKAPGVPVTDEEAMGRSVRAVQSCCGVTIYEFGSPPPGPFGSI